MSEIVLLDTGLLRQVTHPRHFSAEKRWIDELILRNRAVLIPDIVDYELRREILRAGQRGSVRRLDLVRSAWGTVHITTSALKRAAELWAEARQRGRVTAGAGELDGDVILAAQAQLLAEREQTPVIVATTNVRHLAWFVDARPWSDIEPDG